MAKARTTRKVSVQQSDITDGVQNDPNQCTIQMAVARAFPDVESIRIVSGMVRIMKDDSTEWVYQIPRAAACIPIMIDEGLRDKVEPLDFTLSAPQIVKVKKRDYVEENRRRNRNYVEEKKRAKENKLNGGINQNISDASKRSAQQRATAKRMSKALKEYFGAKDNETRFQGIEI